ncbi:MAG TPA: farnesyl diphosphate synthase [Phycisphaerae bacterium]|nr:farnesyl diphosphate synthase [Phycisphaerae bacterium]
MTEKSCMVGLDSLLSAWAERVEADLAQWTVEPDTPVELAEVMRYCVLGGGKRLRPGLVYLTAETLGGDLSAEPVRRSAVAVELVHGYSLVHDDLPSMDDDTLRRGHPTAHVKFGEAMAVLAGDALLTRAFAVLGEMDSPAAGRLVAELARAAGCAGMVAGQVADMMLCDVPRGCEGLRYIHLRKTAALMRAAARMGAICADGEPAQLQAVDRYAENLGLAFQLIDDLLDVTGSAEDLGKIPGKDQAAGKRTHVAEMGLDRTRRLGAELTREAIESLLPLGQRANPLVRLAELLAERTR